MPDYLDSEKPFLRPLSRQVVSPLPPAIVPARTPLTGQYVELIPLNAVEHHDALYDASHHSPESLKIWEYLPYGPWSNKADYLAVLRQQSASFDPIFYVIKLLSTDTVCGQASFLNVHSQNGSIEIGHIWFSPCLQRTQAATEALFLLMDYAMSDLAYRRLEWKCNALNAGSRAAARRLGFRFEGIFYNHIIAKGRNRDTAWYSILDSEWQAVRHLIKTWLAESNFDATGKVKTSLTTIMQNRASADTAG